MSYIRYLLRVNGSRKILFYFMAILYKDLIRTLTYTKKSKTKINNIFIVFNQNLLNA